MRIIRGTHQRRLIIAPDNLPVRPTTDMAKESLFNILENQLDFEDTTALDLFAGTGNISYELASRGCQRVTAVDDNNNCVRFIRETALKLNMPQISVVRSDVFRFLPKHAMKYDIVFADPPYALEGLETLPDKVYSADILHPGCYFILEHGDEHSFTEHPYFKKEKKYGRVHFSFFRKED